MIYLFTDFGAADIYVGQVKACLASIAPAIPVIDLSHAAPAFRVRASAHLLCALANTQPPASVTLAVVDPGVGTARKPIAVRTRDRWFVGPDNGLLSIIAARSNDVALHEITWRPDSMSHSFHGRDLFAPIAGRLAVGEAIADALEPIAQLEVAFGAADLAKVIYIDHYGNALTGLRAPAVDASQALDVNGRAIRFARVFGEAAAAEPFWYENSIGLVEIAVNQGNAARRLGLNVGDAIRVSS